MTRILAIDDEPGILDAIEKTFSDYEVVTTMDGCEAIITLVDRRAEFDCVICDFLMPNCNGKDVYDAIRDSRPELLKRIVFLTGGTNIPGINKFLEDIPCPKLDKPFSIAELRKIVDSLVRDTLPAPPMTPPPESA